MMTDTIERVFGRGRLKMTTGDHVEVFREAVAPGERRRYTKRFLETGDADFRQWTQREWRMLARLIGHGVHCVPDVVQFDGGAKGGLRQVQTYDAGVTVDQWAALLPVSRNGVVRRHMFEDCAHWWALAHHCLAALDEIHRLQLVHLDIKADNICIPYDPPTFDPTASDARVYPAFARLALIDFAFSLVSREPLQTALPLGWQKDYDYQSPRLLRALEAGLAGDLAPTQELDWRCDLYSLAAMLRRYLPHDAWARSQGGTLGWTAKRYEDARALIYRLREAHDREVASVAPHAELMQITAAQLAADDLTESLAAGWTLAPQGNAAEAAVSMTPLTRIAAPRPTATPTFAAPMTAITQVPAVFRSTRIRVAMPPDDAVALPTTRTRRRPRARVTLAAALAAALVGATIPLVLVDRLPTFGDGLRARIDDMRASFAGKSTEPGHTRPARAAAAPALAAAKPVELPRQSVAPTREVVAPPVEAAAPAREVVASPVENANGTREVISPPGETAARPTQPHPVANATRHDEAPPPPQHRVAIVPKSSPRSAPDTRARTAPDVHVPRPMPSPPPVPPPSVDLTAAAKATRALVLASLPTAEELAAVMPKRAQTKVAPATVGAPAPVESVAVATPSPTPAPSVTPEAAAAMPSVQVAPATTPPIEPRRPRQRAPESAPVEPWRLALRDMMDALNLTQAKSAPVEERNVADAASPKPGQHRTAPPARAIAPAEPNVAVAVRSATPQESDPLLNQAHNLMRADLPRIAEQAHNDIASVLWTAAGGEDRSQDRAVMSAAVARWQSERLQVTGSGNAARARELYEDAKHAFASGHDRAALDQALRAFAANPRDADIAGLLAMLHLRVSPIQPEAARQLALYALAMSGANRNIRHDDWNTFAVASALSGRESDAARALLAELALSTDVDRSCRAALGAYNMFGERLRAPVQALMYRVHAQGRDRDSTSCRWNGTRSPARYAATNDGRF